MDDATLVQRVLDGDVDAYEVLVRRWGACLFALCLLRVRRADVAEDLVQETLMRGFQKLPSLDEPARFRSWLGGIARNVCSDWLEAQQRQSALPLGDYEPLDRQPDPAAQLEQADQQSCLDGAVQSLPEDLRTVLLLFYSGNYRYGDIAEILGVSSATVNARLTRARAQLRDRLRGGSGGSC